MNNGERVKKSARELKIAAPQIRKSNREAIFEYIKRNPGATKNDLALSLALSRPTVSGIIEELEKEGLIREERSSTNTGGRSAMEYQIIPEAYLAAGLQLSEHHMRGVVVNLAGEVKGVIREKKRFEANEEYRKTVGEIYQKLLSVAKVEDSQIKAVGVAVQALTDAEGKKITYMPKETGKLSRYDQLLKYIPGEKRLFHDLTALGYNEKIKVDSNVFYLSINNRIGGMMLIGNEVYNGSNHKAGEIGHIQLEHNGRECYCGNKGCFDAYCNTNILRECANGSLEDFFKGVSEEKASYLNTLQEYIEYLADAIFSIRIVFGGVIIIGGEIGKYAEYYIDAVRDILDKKVFFPDEHAAEYLLADQTGEYAIAIGAAMYYCGHVLDTFEKNKKN